MSSGRGHKLYIGGLSASVEKEDLMRELGKFGAIGDVWLARNPPGFAFVEFEKAADAEKAVRALDGITVCDSRLRVEFAHSKPRTGGGTPRVPDTRRPAISDSRNGRSSSQRRYSSPRRRAKSPPPHNGHLESSRYPYGQLASLYTPDVASAAAAAAAAAGFPYQLPGYPPVFPFIPPEELFRGLQGHRRRSPVVHRAASPDYRRRSRSPVERTVSRTRGRDSLPYDDYDRRDYSRGSRSQLRGRASPVRRAVSPIVRRHEVDRPRSVRDDRKRR